MKSIHYGCHSGIVISSSRLSLPASIHTYTHYMHIHARACAQIIYSVFFSLFFVLSLTYFFIISHLLADNLSSQSLFMRIQISIATRQLFFFLSFKINISASLLQFTANHSHLAVPKNKREILHRRERN